MLKDVIAKRQTQLGRGLFIVLEAPDCAGKTTQALMLSKRLPDSVLTREAGGTELGKQMRRLALDPAAVDMAKLMLFCADRAQHVAEVIAPSLAAGKTVICDRYHLSTVAYQAYGLGLDYDKVVALSKWACSGHMPDVTIYLDTSPALRQHRLRQRSIDPDCFESNAKLMQRVADGYAYELPLVSNAVGVDGEGKPVHVSDSIIASLTAKLEALNA